MWKDEIIEELYAQRAAHAAKLGYSPQKFFEELKAHEALSRAQGWQFVGEPADFLPPSPENTTAANHA
jgi:hypothetical protein